MLRAMLPELIMYIIGYFIFILFNVTLYKIIKNKRVATILILISLIIYAGIRYNVGSDYDTYYIQYNNIEKYFSSIEEIIKSDIQFAFTLIMFLTKKYIINEFALFTVMAIIIYPITIKAIKKYSKDVIESLLLYFTLEFHLVSLNQLKQVISMTFLLYGLDKIVNKKKIAIIVMTILMVVFHISSIIPIIILIVATYIKPTKIKMIMITIFSIILCFTYDIIINNISFFARYQRYLVVNREYYIVIIGAIGYLIFNMIVLAMLMKNKDKLIETNKNNKVILSALILTIPIKMLGIVNFPIYRISLFIDQFLIFIIPDLIKIYTNKNKNIYIMYLAIQFLWLTFSIVFLPHNNFYTYQTIFQIIN